MQMPYTFYTSHAKSARLGSALHVLVKPERAYPLITSRHVPQPDDSSQRQGPRLLQHHLVDAKKQFRAHAAATRRLLQPSCFL
jgi:hypothetical protein